MARIRTIKPEFPQSETIGSLSRDARLLFILLWTLADDFGRARASSRVLASLLYPYDDDAPSLIGGWLDELEGKTCVRRYEIEGKLYLDIPNWLKHQKIDHPTPSKLPEFREDQRELREDQRELRPGSVREGKGRDRDRDREGTGTFPLGKTESVAAREEPRSLASAPPTGALAPSATRAPDPDLSKPLTEAEWEDERRRPGKTNWTLLHEHQATCRKANGGVADGQ